MGGLFGTGVFGLIVAPKAGVVVLMALAVLAAIWGFREIPLSAVKRPITAALLILVAWSVGSALNAGQIAHELVALLKMAALMISGIVVVNYFTIDQLSKSGGGTGGRTILPGVAVGAVILAGAAGYASFTGEAPWGSFYFDPLTTLNNSAVVLSLMLWPLVAWLRGRRHAAGVAVITLAVIVIGFLSSGAAVGALIVGGTVLLFRRLAGRSFGVIVATLLAVSTLVLPYAVGSLESQKFMTQEVVNDSSSDIPYSARHRLAMWAFAAKKIDEKPLLGWGFNASRHIPQEEFRLAPNMEIMPLHPHNLALQTRLELGVPGALILAGLVFVVFYRLATFTEDHWKSGLAMAPAAAWLFVANVSYGMWQSWWIALAFLLIVIMRLALADPPDRKV